MKLLVEPPHFSLPFRDESFWAYNQDVLDILSGLHFAQYETCLNRLANTDFIGNQQPRLISSYKTQQWFELEWNKLYSRRMKRI